MNDKANNISRRYQKEGGLEYQILKVIGENGAQSVTEIAKRVGCSKPTISRKLKTMDQRAEEAVIRRVVFEKHPTKQSRENYFVLIDGGIEKLISSKNETLDTKTVWKILYFSFHKSSERNVRKSLDYFVSLYEKNNLGFSFEYIQFYPRLNFELADYYEKQQLNLDRELGKAFDFVGYNMPVNKKELGNIFGKEILSLFFKKRSTEGRQLFTPIQLNQSKIELTVFGLLLLLRRLYDQAGSKKLLDKEVKNRIGIIQKRYAKLIPKIFDKWDELKKLVTNESKLLIYFSPSHSRVYYPSIHDGGIQELLDSMDSMGIVYKQKLEKEFDLATKTILELKTSGSFYDILKRYTKNGIYQPPHLVVNHPLNHILNEYAILLNQEIRFGLEGFSEAEKRRILDKKDASYADAASFRFYAYLFRPHGIINQDIAYSFLEENNLKDWYNGWLKEILRFQNQNIKSIELLLA